MNLLKPAIATSASAGIRRMETGKPSALGMRTYEGKGAGQWLLAMGCAKSEHPLGNTSAHRAKCQTEWPHKMDENGLLNTILKL